jgi:hypothetical protein
MPVKTSFWNSWGPQPLLDLVLLKSLLKAVGDVVGNTYMPVLRLTREDRPGLERTYAELLARREVPSSRWASPRERWAVLYGNFIRELEWACKELQKELSKEDYEDLTTRSISDSLERWIGALMPSLASMMAGEGGAKRAEKVQPTVGAAAKSKSLPARLLQGAVANIALKMLNPASFLVGPVEIKSMDPKRGVVIYIPECWMHTVVSDTEPQTEACLQMCKGGCERFFGANSPIEMYFDPHLPRLDCTLRTSWSGPAIDLEA